MPATIETVTRIAHEVARASGQFEVMGVIPAEGGSYAEILLSVNGCRVAPCRFALGVLRDTSEDRLREAIREQLTAHVGHIPLNE